MTLTERKLTEFFPANHRFIHYCAKRYGYTFFNQEAVESAHYHSAVNLTRYLQKHGREFETESKMVAVIMGSIRYGILTAISDKSRKASRKYKRSVEAISESDLMVEDNERSTKYEKALATYDEDFFGIHMLEDSFKKEADYYEEFVYDNHIIEGKPLEWLSVEHGIPSNQLRNAKQRIKTKFKHLIKNEEHQLRIAKDIINHETEIRPISEDVQEEHRDRCVVEKQDKERSYSEAMSFLYSSEEV